MFFAIFRLLMIVFFFGTLFEYIKL